MAVSGVYCEMKRALKISIIGIVVIVGGTALWCTLYPLLFPARMKATQAEYQRWLGEQSSTNK